MDGFKQRIIGALVIVCLAVIFLPMLFDEPHEERQRQTVDIPQEPDFPEVRVEDPQPQPEPEMEESVPTPEATVEEPRDDVAAVDDPPQDEPSAPDEEPVESRAEPVEPAETPEATQPELEGSYLVQLGSFSSAENARGLRDSVREEGLEAYTETISRDDQTLTRVYAGPFLDKSDAEAAKKLLDETFGLQTLVVTGG